MPTYSVSIDELVRHYATVEAEDETQAYELARLIIMGQLDYDETLYDYYTDSEGFTGNYYVEEEATNA